MRSFIVMAMLTAPLAQASWSDYQEERQLELDADGVAALYIEAGAGSLKVRGEDGATSIVVVATIQVDTSDEDRAREVIEERMTLSLDRDGDQARLESFFHNNGWANSDGSIALDIEMPRGIQLYVDDGSGSITIEDVESDVEIEDGSGSLKIYNVHRVDVDDGSGSIVVENATGDVNVVDGSGSITITGVGGSVRIDDGSGSITIDDVENDVIIEEDGSGGVSVADVRGSIEQDD